MRNDLDSLNSGKGMAQAAHAANCFVEDIGKLSVASDEYASYREWKTQTTQGFGTTIVLESPLIDIEMAVAYHKNLGYVADIVLDPTYPIKDGQITHLVPLITCGYIFSDSKYLKKFGLHK